MEDFAAIYCPLGIILCTLMEIPLVIAYALNNSLDQGEDFYNPEILIEQIRKVRNIGCGGKILYDKTTIFR